ncbi:MAG: long-chain fatty acid--CoA ligase [Deltaproteobacteria bacterium]|nr:long-chain fatty acid--CoA ligase [Deltaproteobacteria bacterium]
MVKKAGRYVDISWKEWAGEVERVAGGLLALGVRQGERIGLLAENCPEWSFADLGILSCHAVDVPVYPTNKASQVAYLMNNSEASTIFVSTVDQLRKTLEAAASCPQLRKIIVFAAQVPAELRRGELVMTLAELQETGRQWLAANPGRLEGIRGQIDEDDLATIIYTSGTTGDPKGVMLTHKNFYSNCAATASVNVIGHQDIALSHLPLSHVLERMAGYYLMIYAGATIAYAESIDAVAGNMVEVGPTVMISVPRLYEKIYTRIQEGARQSKGLRRRIVSWSFRVAEQLAACHDAGRKPGAWLAWQQSLARKLVFSKLGEKLGGRMKYFVSGGAPLPRKIAEFFYATGYPIYEGYGLTETSPVLAVNTPAHLRFGTVGRPIPGVEIKIAADGEILARGPNVSPGYYRNPEATREAFVDGWFHTGDIGEIDADGYLKITDRKKDLIVTAGGKNIAPQHLENLLKMDPYISEVMLYGDRRKFIAALIVPDFELLAAYALEHDILYQDFDELVADPLIVRLIEDRIRQVHEQHDIPGYEQVKKFVLLGNNFSMDLEEVTPTLKLRRKIVTAKYQQQLDALYEE